MASRFWVGGTGTWDASDTTHWSATTGGAGGASVPGASDTVTLDASSGGGTVTVNTDFSVVSVTMGAFTGTLDFSANNNNPTMQSFSGTGTGNRTLTMGSGTWTLTGNAATIWNCATTTGLTFTKGANPIISNYSGATGTRTINQGSNGTPTLLTQPDFRFTAGTDSIALSTVKVGNIDFTGFAGTWAATGTFVIYGDLIFSSGMLVAESGNTIQMSGTTGTQILTTNNISILRGITVNAPNTIILLVGNLNLTSVTQSNSTLTITSGIFNANNYNISTYNVSSSNTNTRTITMGSGTWTLTGTGTVWNTATNTNLTLNSDSSTIKVTNTSASAVTISTGGGKTYNNLWFARGTSTGTNNLLGTGTTTTTFADIKDDGSIAHSLLLLANTTTAFTTWNVNGASAGQLITLSSSTAATHTLKNNGSTSVVAQYLAISYSIAT